MVYSNGDIAANYTPTYVTYLGHRQASSTTTLACPASVVYSGAAQTPCTATVTVTGAPGVTGLIATTQYVNTPTWALRRRCHVPGQMAMLLAAPASWRPSRSRLPRPSRWGTFRTSLHGQSSYGDGDDGPASLAYTISYTGVAPTVMRRARRTGQSSLTRL